MEQPSPQTGRRFPVILVILVIIGAFLGGIAVDRLLLSGQTTAGAAAPVESNALIDEALSVIRANYVDQTATGDDQMLYGALTGMVDALGDTGHSRFLDPNMVRAQRDSTAGQFEGIGAYVEMRDGFVTIVSPIDGSPAQAAGVQPGDIVIEVDGEDVTGQSLQEVISKILGEAGTDVEITFVDGETGEERTLIITRARIDLENVTWGMLPDSTLAQLRISSFSRDVGEDLREAVEAAEAAGATGLVLDLRNNPGGLLQEAVEVASIFLPDDADVLLRQDGQGNIDNEPVQRSNVRTDLPLVVLINEGSASASEIVSGALQDAGRATLVGEQSFGTGTVLNQFGLSDGSAILLATEQWLTPAGRVIWREGIMPDIVAELESGAQLFTPSAVRELTAELLDESGDNQILLAISVLNGDAPLPEMPEADASQN